MVKLKFEWVRPERAGGWEGEWRLKLCGPGPDACMPAWAGVLRSQAHARVPPRAAPIIGQVRGGLQVVGVAAPLNKLNKLIILISCALKWMEGFKASRLQHQRPNLQLTF